MKLAKSFVSMRRTKYNWQVSENFSMGSNIKEQQITEKSSDTDLMEIGKY
jgi:hypothetical protein